MDYVLEATTAQLKKAAFVLFVLAITAGLAVLGLCSLVFLVATWVVVTK